MRCNTARGWMDLEPVREPLQYDRTRVISFCRRVLRGIVAHMDPKRHMPILPYDSQPPRPLYNRCPEEAFERSMVAAAIYARATGSSELDGANFTHHWREGLLQWVDPSSAHFIQRPAEHSPLGSEVALAAMICPEEFWTPFTEEQRQWIARFFDATTRNSSFDNNHWLFHMVPLTLVEACGVQSHREALEAKLCRCFDWHRGDGWFVDGCNKGYDWYTNHGFHLYFQILLNTDAIWRERFGDEIRELARLYQDSFPLLFDSDGSMVPMGRSLAYRFVHVAPIAWMILNDSWKHPLGLAKTLIFRHLQYFEEGGCLTPTDLLPPGYFEQNMPVLEDYMDYGAQYFAVHGFSCLLLPEEHPFWQAEPLEVVRGSAVLQHGAVIRRSPERGAVYFNVHNGFRPEMFEAYVKYFQHDYGSRTGLFVSRDPEGRHVNQHGCSVDGGSWRYRNGPRCLFVSDTKAISAWRIGLPDECDDQMVLHHLFFEHGEVYILYHTAAVPLWVRFSGPAHLCADPGSVELCQLAGPPGVLGDVDAGVDLLHARPGVFSRWESAKPVRALVPITFAVVRQTGADQITCEQTADGLLVRWAAEERAIMLPTVPSVVAEALRSDGSTMTGNAPKSTER